jgi:aminoglycoside/choline kinase family phosphotransferase
VYLREVLFYEQAAGKTALRTPALYAGGFEPESGLSLLLLEDLAPARAGNQEAGCSLAEAQAVLRHLARCHAGWWESPELAGFSWLPGFNQGIDLEALYARSWAPFLARFQSDLPEWMVALGERFGLHVRQIRDELAASPWTLVHGDLRLDNLFLLGSAEDPEPAVLDWQAISRGRGLFDVAYFLAGNLDEHRPELIRPLVEGYHRTLLDHGVRGYDLDQCLRDHRLATLFLLARTVITGGQLDMSQESARSRFLTVLRRGMSAFRSFAVAALLES